jgi:septal ring factor EnvC (AmiA/AmiB activator)
MRFSREHREQVDRLEAIKKELADIKREIQSEKTSLTLTHRINDLKKEIAKLEIERDKTEEGFDRRERETEHKVGLLLKQQEFEVEKARQETALEVRESNLEAERERFETEMKFMRERMEKEVDYVKEIVEKILTRLPDISASLSVGSGNGSRRDS